MHIYIYTYSFCIGCIPSVVIGVHGHLGFHSATFVMLILNSELIILYFIEKNIVKMKIRLISRSLKCEYFLTRLLIYLLTLTKNIKTFHRFQTLCTRLK